MYVCLYHPLGGVGWEIIYTYLLVHTCIGKGVDDKVR